MNGRAGRPNQKSLIEKADQAFARTRYYLDWCAAQGHWSEAVAESEKRIRANPDDHYSWYQAAFVFAVQGESARYRRHCAEMLARFGSTKEAAIAQRITKASLILPPDSATLEKAQVLAERAVTIGANDDLSRFFQLAHALADFRAGPIRRRPPMARQMPPIRQVARRLLHGHGPVAQHDDLQPPSQR